MKKVVLTALAAFALVFSFAMIQTHQEASINIGTNAVVDPVA